jgi:hypothetical protein
MTACRRNLRRDESGFDGRIGVLQARISVLNHETGVMFTIESATKTAEGADPHFLVRNRSVRAAWCMAVNLNDSPSVRSRCHEFRICTCNEWTDRGNSGCGGHSEEGFSGTGFCSFVQTQISSHGCAPLVVRMVCSSTTSPRSLKAYVLLTSPCDPSELRYRIRKVLMSKRPQP